MANVRSHSSRESRTKLVTCHVVAKHVEIRQRQLGQEAGLQIGRGDTAFQAVCGNA
jgi:hypothetical protein